jgi:hypothetical protein
MTWSAALKPRARTPCGALAELVSRGQAERAEALSAAEGSGVRDERIQ